MQIDLVHTQSQFAQIHTEQAAPLNHLIQVYHWFLFE